MRIYHAVCDVLEAFAEHLRSATIEQEFEAIDWNQPAEIIEDDE